MGPSISPVVPVTLFKDSLLGAGYDVSAARKRFITLEPPEREPPLSVHIVHNWFEEFRSQTALPR
jgi:hypothetical protein